MFPVKIILTDRHIVIILFLLFSERGAAWIAHYLGVVGVDGSNPFAPIKQEGRSVDLPFLFCGAYFKFNPIFYSS